MTTHSASIVPETSPFADHPVAALLGLDLDAGGAQPQFTDEIWDLRGVRHTPTAVAPYELCWDFTQICQPQWRWVAREFMVALRSPHHERVAMLGHARRDQLSLRTCAERLWAITGWMRWLADNGIRQLGELTQTHCDRYLAHRRGDNLSSSSLMREITAIKDLARYGALFTTDRYPTGFTPWPRATAATVAGHRGDGENTTPVVSDAVLRPALQAAVYLVQVLGPRVAHLSEQVAARRAVPRTRREWQCMDIEAVMAGYLRERQPLPEAGRGIVSWPQFGSLIGLHRLGEFRWLDVPSQGLKWTVSIMTDRPLGSRDGVQGGVVRGDPPGCPGRGVVGSRAG